MDQRTGEQFDSVGDPDEGASRGSAGTGEPGAVGAEVERFDAFGAGGPGGVPDSGAGLFADTAGPSGPVGHVGPAGTGSDAGRTDFGAPAAFDTTAVVNPFAAVARVEPRGSFDGFANGSGGRTGAVSASASASAEGHAPAGRPAPAPRGSFDAFAVGNLRPATEHPAVGMGGGPAGGPVGGGSALPALRAAGETSLFDSTMPLPKTARPARDPFAPELGTTTGGGSARVRRVVTSDYLLTINPVDGTEVITCPPEERPTPVRRTREERAARIAAARPTPPPGPPAPELPLLERDEERERLIRLLARGRSTRVTGPSGAGRTSLLESVANACGDLAPDGVLWLSGYRRTAADVLQDLYAVVYGGEGHRPGRAELPELLREVGAVVVLDDLEFGGAALEELLAAAPECAFLMSATPDVPAPAADSMVEEVYLAGLTRVACLDLLQLVAGRRLEEDETAWAADLWFESEGLPLRFVQAGALLRQRDALRQPVDPDWDDSVWENGSPAAALPPAPEIPDLSAFDGPGDADSGPTGGSVPGGSAAGGLLPVPASASVPPPPRPRLSAADVPLPSLAESAAPADLLASRLSESAREALAFAVALDGECPHASHLPALVGDTHGDAALGELTAVGLAVPVASHFRLAAGVAQHLAVALADEGELSDVQAHTAALHYAWWSGHPSVTPERCAAEAEAILAAMAACRDGGHPGAAVLLARTVAPAFAAALHWGAWERALRVGQEAARLSGEVAEEAYFLHELGVLALCTGNTDRARAELEASIALRGALADRQGTVVGRRTLALVNDRAPTAGSGPLELPPGAADVTAPLPELGPGVPPVVITKQPPGSGPGGPGVRRLAVVGTRRNLVAAGTGVVIAALLGTIVTVGLTSGGDDDPPHQVKPIESVQQDAPDETTPPTDDGTPTVPSSSATTTASPTDTATRSTPPTAVAGGDLSSPPDTPGTPTPTATTAGSTSGGHSTTGGGKGGTTTSGGSTSKGATSSGGSSSGSSAGASAGTTSGSSSGTTTGTTSGSTTGASGGTTAGPTGGTTTSGSTSSGGTTAGPTGGTTTSGGADPSGGTEAGGADSSGAAGSGT
ncbi:ATP-binding protein [Streptomyces sp. NBC_00138]|nr:ATP-binding protein [Streptomyces sp. NBC_00223]